MPFNTFRMHPQYGMILILDTVEEPIATGTTIVTRTARGTFSPLVVLQRLLVELSQLPIIILHRTSSDNFQLQQCLTHYGNGIKMKSSSNNCHDDCRHVLESCPSRHLPCVVVVVEGQVHSLQNRCHTSERSFQTWWTHP